MIDAATGCAAMHAQSQRSGPQDAAEGEAGKGGGRTGQATSHPAAVHAPAGRAAATARRLSPVKPKAGLAFFFPEH
jgi:hypothetical protein